ncbi:uncharacterized protein [Lepidochelys kempii]|uniref:uncharacterized protein n=1 Tax=Lepidochelys kempii TaxID=8472 RepID=UPI003C6EFF58
MKNIAEQPPSTSEFPFARLPGCAEAKLHGQNAPLRDPPGRQRPQSSEAARPPAAFRGTQGLAGGGKADTADASQSLPSARPDPSRSPARRLARQGLAPAAPGPEPATARGPHSPGPSPAGGLTPAQQRHLDGESCTHWQSKKETSRRNRRIIRRKDLEEEEELTSKTQPKIKVVKTPLHDRDVQQPESRLEDLAWPTGKVRLPDQDWCKCFYTPPIKSVPEVIAD